MSSSKSDSLDARLTEIHEGSRWFQIVGVVLLVLGTLALGGSALKLMRLLGPSPFGEVFGDVAPTVAGGIAYLVLSSLAFRAAGAFTTIAALIREIGEIV